MNICVCKRSFIHCRVCGRRNPYPKKFRSLERSKEVGYDVVVRACQTCGNETDESMPCQAPPYKGMTIPYQAEVKPIDNSPQFSIDVENPQYAIAFGERYNAIADSMKYRSSDEVLQAMFKEGWVDIRGKVYPEPIPTPIPAIQEPIDGSGGISLNDVIEKMRLEQK